MDHGHDLHRRRPATGIDTDEKALGAGVRTAGILPD